MHTTPSSIARLRPRSAARGATVAAALLGASLLTACSLHAGEPATRPHTPVRVARIVTGPAVPAVATSGVVANKDEARLAFKIGGVIETVAVEEGQSVHKGQLLARIEPPEADAQLEQARALAEKAERDLARGERLYADQVISLEQLQDLRTQSRVAAAQLASVRFNRGYAAIVAPADGVVLRKLAQARELVSAGQPVLAVGARTRGVVIRAALSDRELVLLRLGDPAQVQLDALPGTTLTGRLAEAARAADERTGLFPVEVRLDDPPAALASGMVARLRLLPAAGRDASLPYVPLAALLEGEGHRASVFVLDGAHARRRSVEVAFITPLGAAVRKGLKPGDQVVTDGALYLDDGDPVDVITDRAATGPGNRPIAGPAASGPGGLG